VETVIKITNECLCRCAMCYGAYEGRQPKTPEMALPVFRNIATERTKHVAGAPRPILIVSGGEPLLHSQIGEILRFSRGLDATVVLNTSGNVGDRLDWLLNQGETCWPDVMVFSIDSIDPARHDSSRGSSGLFDFIVESTQRVLDTTHISVCFRFTLTRHTHRDLPRLVRASHELGIQGLKITFVEAAHDSPACFRREDISALKRTLVETRRVVSELRPEVLQSRAIEKHLNAVLEALESDGGERFIGSNYDSFAGDPCPVLNSFRLYLPDGHDVVCCQAEYYSRGSASLRPVRGTLPFAFCEKCAEGFHFQISFAEAVRSIENRRRGYGE